MTAKMLLCKTELAFFNIEGDKITTGFAPDKCEVQEFPSEKKEPLKIPEKIKDEMLGITCRAKEIVAASEKKEIAMSFKPEQCIFEDILGKKHKIEI
jgi:hypothetical protein